MPSRSLRLTQMLLLSFILFAVAPLLSCGSPSRSGGDAVNMQEVQSSAIRSVGYDASSQTLAITFVSGSTYEYSDVPRDVYEELLSAPSKGKYFNARVKGQYSYRRIR